MASITVLDYGMGNLRSIGNALTRLGADWQVQSNIGQAEKLILPGVGAFGAAMQRLHPIAEEIRAFARSGQPILGVCLGQQLLFEASEEFGEHQGLGLIGGKVEFFPNHLQEKVPHVGWNRLAPDPESRLLRGIDHHDQVYFVHSLVCRPSDPFVIAATTKHGIEFASAIESGTIWATQFHPEKSGPVGLQSLRNFVEC